MSVYMCNLTSHTLRRERKGLVMLQERNYRLLQLGNEILTSTKHIVT